METFLTSLVVTWFWVKIRTYNIPKNNKQMFRLLMILFFMFDTLADVLVDISGDKVVDNS